MFNNKKPDPESVKISKSMSDFIHAVTPSSDNTPVNNYTHPENLKDKKSVLMQMFPPLGQQSADLIVELKIRRWAWKMQQEALARHRQEQERRDRQKNSKPPWKKP